MKKVLIIGAGFLQSFVIRKAKEMGFYTLAVDANPESIGFKYADEYGVVDIIDKEACLKFAREHEIDGVLTAATDYGVLSASYVASKMGLPGLDYSSAKRIKNKYFVRECLFEKCVDEMKQAYEVNIDTDLEELALQLDYPVVVKPCDGSGSRGTSRVDLPEKFEDACRYAINNSLTRRAEVESFITGQEYGAESLVINGEVHVLSIMKKWMTKPPYYAELGHAIPCGLSKEIEQKAISCVKKAIEALEINSGSVNTDLIITKDGKVYIIDIGARMGGNMIGACIIPYGTGIDYMAAMLQNAVSEPVDLTEKTKAAVATKIIALKGGTIKRLPDFKKLEEDYDVEIYHHMSIGDIVNEYKTNIDGCGYIVAKAENVDEAVKKAEKVLDYIANYIFS